MPPATAAIRSSQSHHSESDDSLSLAAGVALVVGVADGLGVVGVKDGLGVVGVAVSLGVAVRVAVRVDVTVSVAVAVTVGSGVSDSGGVGVGVAVRVELLLGLAVAVSVPSGEGADTLADAVLLTLGRTLRLGRLGEPVISGRLLPPPQPATNEAPSSAPTARPMPPMWSSLKPGKCDAPTAGPWRCGGVRRGR